MSIAALDAEILQLRARVAGREMERAMLTGNRDAAEAFRVQMYDLIAQRMDAAEQAGECFFTAAGECAPS